jgi:hypothetical protein
MNKEAFDKNVERIRELEKSNFERMPKNEAVKLTTELLDRYHKHAESLSSERHPLSTYYDGKREGLRLALSIMKAIK